ncbi:response regulator [Lysobacter firmicutimachus]|uniref:Response regulator n=1 Tax=Lysobacter firmicutimachus TaxID=1792846 RepID=A0AAU8MVF1_9GAMM
MTDPSEILVVDDDASIREALCEYLSQHGYCVRGARDAVEMDRLLTQRAVDVVVLDLMLPGEDGFSICRRLSAAGQSVLMLSALGTSMDRVVGLETGADDYLAKPFEPRELLARIRALRRRRAAAPTATPPPSATFTFAGWRFQPAERLLWNPNHAAVALTPLEYAALQAFVERSGRLLSRETLMLLIHGPGAEPFDRSIDLLISRLRRKLACPGQAELIDTVRGEGYRFNAQVQRS